MATPKAKRLVKDPTRWEEEYERTQRPEYLVMAIGLDPSSVPDWAIEGCKEFLRRTVRETHSDAEGDDKRVHDMSVLMITGQADNPRDAAHQVTGEDRPKTGHAPNARRIYKRWKYLKEEQGTKWPTMMGDYFPRKKPTE